MSDLEKDETKSHKNPEQGSTPGDEGVFCMRLEARLPAAEHAQCAYCHGAKADIAPGEHKEFCNFDPEKDPIHFGFPEGTTRDSSG